MQNVMFKMVPMSMLRVGAVLASPIFDSQNTKLLADRKVVSANELALGKAKLDKATAELSLAKVHRDFTAGGTDVTIVWKDAPIKAIIQ